MHFLVEDMGFMPIFYTLQQICARTLVKCSFAIKAVESGSNFRNCLTFYILYVQLDKKINMT